VGAEIIATAEKPVWFTVKRWTNFSQGYSHMIDTPWTVRYHTLDSVRSGRRSHCDFTNYSNREEAIEAGHARGWTLVNTWKEAEQLARPHLRKLRRAREAEAEARAGLIRITVGSPLDRINQPKVRYVSRELADHILEFLGEPDEHGVVTNLSRVITRIEKESTPA
jgi:hypothetical protein